MRRRAALLFPPGIAAVAAAGWLLSGPAEAAGTAFGEIEARPATVSRRQCVSGPLVGQLCNEGTDCMGHPCQDRNVFNLNVSVRFNATPAELQAIEDGIQDAAEWLFDATDGQLQLGRVTIWNNSSGSLGHVWVFPGNSGCSTGTGTWGLGFAIWAAYDYVVPPGPGCLAHELSHLIFDVRDEYKTELPGCAGNLTNTRYCPVVETGEEACLMECCQRVGTEFCWGHGNPLDPDDLSGGNHDAPLETQQSICRDGRSCWDQIGWSWPNTFLVPSGPPDPDANGLVMNPIDFQHPPATARLVLVLDHSGSMGLEIPTRLDRLKTAAIDVVDLAEDGVEVGIVTFHSTAAPAVQLDPLGSDRTAWVNAIEFLTPQLATNIGAGLDLARQMIEAAGGVTGNTAILLMTDGLNNRPLGMAQADLQAKLASLQMDGIPVFVTCTGDDFGLDSQCAEIASATGGTYVDSFFAPDVPEAFTDFHELAMGRHPAASLAGPIAAAEEWSYQVEVEAGARAATFVVLWDDAETVLDLRVAAPDGTTHPQRPMRQGRFARVPAPAPGTWTVTVRAAAVTGTDRFTSRAYVDNPSVAAELALRHPKIQPRQPFEIYGVPSNGLPVSGASLPGRVLRPDGVSAPVELKDDGGLSGSGDERPGDGIYTATYSNTGARGAYTFEIDTIGRNLTPVCEHPDQPCAATARDFRRQTKVSGTVDDTLRADCPRFDAPPTPADGETVFADAEKTLILPLQASHPDAGPDVVLGHLGLPAGATFSASSGNPAAGQIAWTPVEADAGDHVVIFTATDGECTMASSLLIRVVCDKVCLLLSLPVGSVEPLLTMGNPASCPAGVRLPASVDAVRGDLAAVRVAGDHVDLGAVEPLVCGTAEGSHAFCSGRLDPAAAAFFLARRTGSPSYGSGSAGLPRVPSAGDCP
jgi:hypothetical protein